MRIKITVEKLKMEKFKVEGLSIEFEGDTKELESVTNSFAVAKSEIMNIESKGEVK